MMKNVRPTEAQKNRMLNNAFNSKPKKKSPKLRYCIVTAACVLFSTTVYAYADEIKETFYNLLGKDEITTEDVLTGLYNDTDGHINMTVKEVLSDNITTKAIVEYMALDDEGKQWLDNIQKVWDGFYNSIYDPQIEPCIKDDNIAFYGVSYSSGCEELKEYRSDTIRVFEVVCEASAENESTESVTLTYSLKDRFKKKAVLDISQSVEPKDIKLDGKKLPDKHYRLTGIKISPLSLMLYGENHGLYEYGINYIKSVSDEQIDSCCLIMKDGTKRDFINPLPNQTTDEWSNLGGGAWTLGSVINPDVDYDVSILCTSFITKLDVENVAGIELDRLYYPID